VEELVKLRVDEATSPIMRESDESLAHQRKIRKAALKRLCVKDRIGATRTQQKIFPNGSQERDLEKSSEDGIEIKLLVILVQF